MSIYILGDTLGTVSNSIIAALAFKPSLNATLKQAFLCHSKVNEIKFKHMNMLKKLEFSL
jgi:hypothetical protein